MPSADLFCTGFPKSIDNAPPIWYTNHTEHSVIRIAGNFYSGKENSIMIKLGVNSVLFKAFTYREAAEAIKKCGYDGVEISAIAGM